MCSAKSKFDRPILTCTVALAVASLACVAPGRVEAADSPTMNKSGSGIFVSFRGGLLTLKGKSGHLVYDNVGENYKAFQNNEEGPGSRLVPTVHALSGGKLPGNITPLTRVLPGTLVRVIVEDREIYFGFDYRVIGNFVSYENGKLNLVAADVPPEFVQVPSGKLALSIDPSTPVLESITGDYLQLAGAADEKLKTVKPGTLITARSQYDVDTIEVLEIGVPRYRLERYLGQSRGNVRGTFVSFQDDILRIYGKGIGPLAAEEYAQLIVRRVLPHIRIVESIDGEPYRIASVDALKAAKEGTIITLRKVEDVILEIQVGVPK